MSETCRVRILSNKFEKQCISLAFIIRIYHNARFSECQIPFMACTGRTLAVTKAKIVQDEIRVIFYSDLIHEVNTFTKPTFRFSTKCSGEKVRPRPLNNPAQFCRILQLYTRNYASLTTPQDAAQTVSFKKSRHVLHTHSPVFSIRSSQYAVAVKPYICFTYYVYVLSVLLTMTSHCFFISHSSSGLSNISTQCSLGGLV